MIDPYMDYQAEINRLLKKIQDIQAAMAVPRITVSTPNLPTGGIVKYNPNVAPQTSNLPPTGHGSPKFQVHEDVINTLTQECGKVQFVTHTNKGYVYDVRLYGWLAIEKWNENDMRTKYVAVHWGVAAQTHKFKINDRVQLVSNPKDTGVVNKITTVGLGAAPVYEVVMDSNGILEFPEHELELRAVTMTLSLNPWQGTFDQSALSAMLKKTCDCGSEKTYGPNDHLHAHWCSVNIKE